MSQKVLDFLLIVFLLHLVEPQVNDDVFLHDLLGEKGEEHIDGVAEKGVLSEGELVFLVDIFEEVQHDSLQGLLVDLLSLDQVLQFVGVFLGGLVFVDPRVVQRHSSLRGEVGKLLWNEGEFLVHTPLVREVVFGELRESPPLLFQVQLHVRALSVLQERPVSPHVHRVLLLEFRP